MFEQKFHITEILTETEISYQAHLFKVNRITHEERLINFCVLLGQIGQKVQEMNLPSNEEALTILQEKGNPTEIQHTETEVNQVYVTLWIEKNKHTWYIGPRIGNNNDSAYKIEHLHRVTKLSNLKWKNPKFPDIFLFIKLMEREECYHFFYYFTVQSHLLCMWEK